MAKSLKGRISKHIKTVNDVQRNKWENEFITPRPQSLIKNQNVYWNIQQIMLHKSN